jgi:GNAT superfamily N-acetyltransferase
MIRQARLEDTPAIVELGRAMCVESPTYARFPYNPEKTAASVRGIIVSSRGFAWVGEQDGDVVAVFLALPHEHWACDFVIATEYVLYVHSRARGSSIAARLIAEFVLWGRAVGAHLAVAGSTTGVNEDLTERLYQRLGFKRIGTNLERDLWVSGEQ